MKAIVKTCCLVTALVVAPAAAVAAPEVVIWSTATETTPWGDYYLSFVVSEDLGDLAGPPMVDWGMGDPVPAESIANFWFLADRYPTLGTWDVVVTACDLNGDCGSDTITVSHPYYYVEPTAFAQTVTTAVDTPIGITLAGETVESLPANTYQVVTTPAHGTLSLLAWTVESPQVIIYTPDPGFVGTDTFTFIAGEWEVFQSETDGLSDPATVTIVVGDHSCGGGGDGDPPPPPHPGSNVAPVAHIASMYPGAVGAPNWLNAWYQDGDGDAVTFLWSYTTVSGGATCGFDDPADRWTAITCDAPGVVQLGLAIADGSGGTGSATMLLTIE